MQNPSTGTRRAEKRNRNLTPILPPTPAFTQSPEQLSFFATPEPTEIALCLTDVIEALEAFQDFDNVVKTAAIALRASEMGVAQLHFYAIALHAGLGVEG